MKNKFELRDEREIDIAKTFIQVGASPIRIQAEKVQDGNKPDEFLIFDKIKRLDLTTF